MDFRRLRYFARVVELGSISQAAADLNVAQPALSKSVLALEADLNTELLRRSPQGASPTEAGLRLYEHCQVVFNQLERARHDVSETTHSPSGQVTLGIPYSIAVVILVPLLRATAERLPRVQLQVFQEPRQLLPDRILSGRLDLAVMVYPNPHPGISQKAVVTEELSFVRRFDSALRRKSRITLKEIARQPLILPTRANRLRFLVESLFLAHALPINVVHEVDAIGQFIDCVEAGLASTILPAGVTGRAVSDRRVSTAAIADASFQRTVSIARSQTRSLDAAAVHVERLIHTVIQQTVAKKQWLGATLLNGE